MPRICFGVIALLASRAALAWTAPVDITNLSGVREVGPSLTHDGNGALYMVWFGNGSTDGADGDSSRWRIWFQSHNGASWSPANATPLSGSGAGSPQILCDAGGNLHVVFDQGQEIYYMKRAGGSWSAPLNISSNSNKSIIPHFAINSAGSDLLVAWHESGHTNSTYDIITRHYAGGAWESPVNISNDSGVSSEARVAIDSSGNYHVIWQDADTDHVYYKRRNTDGSWSAQFTLDKTSSRSGTGDVIVTPDNLVHAIFHDDTTGDWETYYTFFNGSSWSTPVNISNHPGPSANLDDIDGNLAIDSFGRLYAVWHDYNDIYFSQKNGASWTTPVKLVSNVYLATSPRITVRSDGVAPVVWQSRPTSGDGYDIYWSSQATTPPGPMGTLAGTVRDQFNTVVSGASVTAGAGSGVTDAIGHYAFTLPTGAYSGTAGKTYFNSQTVNNITITQNNTTTVDFTITRLGPAPVVSFNLTAGNTNNSMVWVNPSSAQFTGTMIRVSTVTSPLTPTDGTLVIDKPNLPNSFDSFNHAGILNGVTYYYAGFAHDGGTPANYSSGVFDSARPAVKADFDRDGDVDLDDFAMLQACFSGPNISAGAECAFADLEPAGRDGDVDQNDLNVFLPCFSGPDIYANPACIP